MVFAAGRRVTKELFATRKPVAPVGLDSVKARITKAADFASPARADEQPVIGVLPARSSPNIAATACPHRAIRRRLISPTTS